MNSATTATGRAKSISDLSDADLRGKRVLVRSDLNVPLDGKRITDDTRVRASVPTIKYLVDKGAKVLVSSHLGRPKGGFEDRYSLAPVAERLGQLLGKPVRMASDCVGDAVASEVSRLNPGDVLLLENVRFYPEEEKNDDPEAGRGRFPAGEGAGLPGRRHRQPEAPVCGHRGRLQGEHQDRRAGQADGEVRHDYYRRRHGVHLFARAGPLHRQLAGGGGQGGAGAHRREPGAPARRATDAADRCDRRRQVRQRGADAGGAGERHPRRLDGAGRGSGVHRHDRGQAARHGHGAVERADGRVRDAQLCQGHLCGGRHARRDHQERLRHHCGWRRFCGGHGAVRQGRSGVAHLHRRRCGVGVDRGPRPARGGRSGPGVAEETRAPPP
eukprot:ctg_18.g2